MIIPMRKEHAKDVGELHRLYIRSFLRDLGRRMCVAFYETELQYENNFGFVYIEDSKALGFIFGTIDNSQLFNPLKIRLELFFSLLKKPWLIKRAFLRYKNEFPPAPERCYWATDLEIRGKGIGKNLFIRLHEEFRKRGIPFYQMRIDSDNIVSLRATQKLFDGKIKDQYVDNGIRRFRLEVSTS